MHLKNKILKLLCILCASSVLLLNVPVFALNDVGKMSSMYGYVLDDYIRTYGVISDEYPHGSPDSGYGTTGVIYSDLVNLDANMPPYMLIYLTEAKYEVVACHVWKYDAATKKAERIAILEKEYSDFTDITGEFGLGWTDDKKYVVYREYRDGKIINSKYYTAIGDDAFMYVNNPAYINEVGIVSFNCAEVTSCINDSYYNEALSQFYDKLKDTAANSITLENFADRLSAEDEDKLESVASKVIGFKSFDISDYSSSEEYIEAVKSPVTNDRFYLITHIYNLGDEIYYLRFSTDRSYYNYALLRKTDMTDDGYQILKVSTDCIPLSASELDEIKEEYTKNNLLYKKSKHTLKAEKVSADATEKPKREPKIKIDKVFDRNIRIPAACIGGAIVLALLTILWIKLYSDD